MHAPIGHFFVFVFFRCSGWFCGDTISIDSILIVDGEIATVFGEVPSVTTDDRANVTDKRGRGEGYRGRRLVSTLGVVL